MPADDQPPPLPQQPAQQQPATLATTHAAPAKPRRRKQPAPPKHHPLEVVRRAQSLGIDSVIVYVSGGKDSISTLELCKQHFARVEAAFMFFVRDLSFQETYLRYLEKRYQLSILRLPHWALSHLYRNAAFRHGTKQATRMHLVKIRDVDCYVRKHFDIHWIASGEKCRDSLERNTQIIQCDAINHDRGRLYPIAHWTDHQVMSYNRLQGVMPAPEYRIFPKAQSFGSLFAQQIVPIHDNFPEDFAKIERQFPLIRAQVLRWKLREQAAAQAKANGKENQNASDLAPLAIPADITDEQGE